MNRDERRRSNYIAPDPIYTAALPEAEVERALKRRRERALVLWLTVAACVVVAAGVFTLLPIVARSGR
jgi:hypothetical protein